MTQQRGFSVLEVLIGSALGLLLIAAAAELLVVGRDLQRTEHAQTRFNDKARLATSLLTRAIHSAGDAGCHPSVQQDLAIAASQDWRPAIHNQPPEPIAARGDVLVIRRMQQRSEAMVDSSSAQTAQIVLNTEHHVEQGELIGLAGNGGMTCLRFYQTSHHALTLDRGPGGNAGEPATALNRFPVDGYQPVSGVVQVFEPERLIFYIDRSVGGSDYSLYRRRQSAGDQREELIVGVRDLEIEYGLDTSGNQQADQWQETIATSLTDAVVAVSLTLEIGVSGQHMREASLTVALRNGRP
ncbi:MAG: PilW family protein [Spiribacter sp.]|nr:PilW family protein [Spiribacter sp.]MDR9488958.1 PilW family protein [Spiribacter sp.]